MPDTIAPAEPIKLAYSVAGVHPKLLVHDRAETISNFLREHRSWQHQITTFIVTYLKPGDVFVDVGANIGYFSVYAGLCVGPNGMVHAVEPDKENTSLLAANVALNGLSNVQVHHTAVGNSTGEARLFRGSYNAGNHSLVQKAELAPGPQVPVTTLTHLLEGSAVPSLIKIDVQGTDFDAMEGLMPLMQAWHKHPAIIVEFSPVDLLRRGQIDSFFGFVETYSYSLRAFIVNARANVAPPRLRLSTLRRIADDFVAGDDVAEFDVLLLPRTHR